MRSRKLNRAIFVLALIFMGVRIDLIGSISLTEIFVIFRIPFLYNWMKYSRIPYLKLLCKLFGILILIQIFAEYMVGNTLVNAMKGVAVTIMALFLFLFFLEKMSRDFSLIKLVPLALLVNLVVWGDQFGYADDNISTYFKFYIAPIITYVVCFISMLKYDLFRKNILFIFFIASIFIIIGGARSLGFSLLFATLLYYIYNHYQTLKLKVILPGLLIIIAVFQILYAFVYVPKVAAGEWGSAQNKEQLARIDNSKNILLMLFSARADFYVAYLAFMDKPLWGHGAWAEDKNFKYTKIQAKLFPKEYTKINKEVKHFVPAHSVVMAMGSRNGILAFLMFLGIFLFIYWVGIKALFPGSLYNVYLIYMIVNSFQHLLFGPPAILKNNGSIAFAVIFVLYYMKEINRRKKYEIQINCCYRNL